MTVAVPVFAAPDLSVPKANRVHTLMVKQADGSVVERLALASLPAKVLRRVSPTQVGMASPSTSGPAQRLEAWLDTVMEPRAMTALAAIPGAPRNEGQTLPELVDPARVRNWAEFVDPTLALRWMAFAEMHGFSEAMLPRSERRGSKMSRAGAPGDLWARFVPWVGAGLSVTWRNAAGEGQKHSQAGRQALEAWLRLPMPAAKSNPRLSELGGSRY